MNCWKVIGYFQTNPNHDHDGRTRILFEGKPAGKHGFDDKIGAPACFPWTNSEWGNIEAAATLPATPKMSINRERARFSIFT